MDSLAYPNVDRRPIWQITMVATGENITANMNPRFIKLDITDKKGFESDELSLELADNDGKLAIPPKGTKLSVAIGWSDSGLVDKGVFTVAEINYKEAPNVLSITAHATPLSKTMGVQHAQSYHQQTLGNILTTIAQRNSLTLEIDASVASINIRHIDQTTESDSHFIARLAQRHNVFISIKANRLIAKPHGNQKTTTGKLMPQRELQRHECGALTFKTADSGKYSGVKAYYHHTGHARRTGVLAGSDIGKDTRVKQIKGTFANEQAAQQAAESEKARLSRGAATLSIPLPHGMPELIPESHISLNFSKTAINGTWVIKEIKHSLNDTGYTGCLECEQI